MSEKIYMPVVTAGRTLLDTISDDVLFNLGNSLCGNFDVVAGTTNLGCTGLACSACALNSPENMLTWFVDPNKPLFQNGKEI